MGDMFKFSRDLSGLLKNGKDLKVSKAAHKAVIEVNEDGSEAAGATCNYANEKVFFFVAFV